MKKIIFLISIILLLCSCNSKQEEINTFIKNKISQEACKQCGRSIPVKIHNPIKFKQMLDMLKDFDIVLFANETNKTISQNDLSKYTSIAIIVGSEGGFSQAEIEEIVKRSTNFGLGERILRTETASIVLCGIVSYLTNN